MHVCVLLAREGKGKSDMDGWMDGQTDGFRVHSLGSWVASRFGGLSQNVRDIGEGKVRVGNRK